MNEFGTWDDFIATANRKGFAFNNLLGQDKVDRWTPTLTFLTPGNLSIAYSTRTGMAYRIGRIVILHFGISIATGDFTHTTASGAARITGVPYTAAAAPQTRIHTGALLVRGITKAGYTDFVCRIDSSAALVQIWASASGSDPSAVTAADMPTGGGVELHGGLIYEV